RRVKLPLPADRAPIPVPARVTCAADTGARVVPSTTRPTTVPFWADAGAHAVRRSASAASSAAAPRPRRTAGGRGGGWSLRNPDVRVLIGAPDQRDHVHDPLGRARTGGEKRARLLSWIASFAGGVQRGGEGAWGCGAGGGAGRWRGRGAGEGA